MLNLIVSMIIWGSIGAFILWSGLSPIDASFFRCLLGVLILFFYCWYRGVFKANKTSFYQYFLIVIGGILLVSNWILLFQSFIWSSITLGNVSYYLQPAFLILLNFFIFREKISLEVACFSTIAFIGVIMTIDVTPETFRLNELKILGVLCALGAGLLYSLATIIAKYLKNVPPSLITFFQLLVGMIFLLPLTHLNTIHFSFSMLSYIGVLGVIHTALAYILYYHAVARLNLTIVAIISYVDPIVAIFTDIAFFDRRLNLLQITGIILTMVASYFVITLQMKKIKTNTQLEPSIQ